MQPHRQPPTRLPHSWDSPGKNTGVGCHFLLQFMKVKSESEKWKWKVKVNSLSHIRLLATSWTAAYQAPPSMGFSRQEYWSGVPLPSPKGGIRIPLSSKVKDHFLLLSLVLTAGGVPCCSPTGRVFPWERAQGHGAPSTALLCSLWQVTSPLWNSTFSSLKLGWYLPLAIGVVISNFNVIYHLEHQTVPDTSQRRYIYFFFFSHLALSPRLRRLTLKASLWHQGLPW